jgi:hypothetical protein
MSSLELVIAWPLMMQQRQCLTSPLANEKTAPTKEGRSCNYRADQFVVQTLTVFMPVSASVRVL